MSKACSRVSQLIRILRKEPIDKVIIFSSSGFSFYEKSLLALISRLFSVDSLLFVRSGHFMTSCHSSFLKKTIARLLLKIPTEIGAQGSQWKTFYRSLGVPGEKVTIVRNWLPERRKVAEITKSFLSTEEELTFVFVGWLVRNKGIFELIEAINESDKLKQCKFLIAGGGNELDNIKELASTYKLNKVDILGWQSPQQIDNLLSQSHVFVLPTYAEGFPNALLEAISQGLPAVISPVGSVADSAIQGENAEWVTPKDVDSLRYSLEKFYDMPKLVEQYSKRSLDIVRELHSREENCKKLFSNF